MAVAGGGGGGGGLALEGGLAAREGLNRARSNSSTQVSLHTDEFVYCACPSMRVMAHAHHYYDYD